MSHGLNIYNEAGQLRLSFTDRIMRFVYQHTAQANENGSTVVDLKGTINASAFAVSVGRAADFVQEYAHLLDTSIPPHWSQYKDPNNYLIGRTHSLSFNASTGALSWTNRGGKSLIVVIAHG